MIAIKTLLDGLCAVTGLLCLAPVLPFLDLPLRVIALTAVAGGWWGDYRGRPLLARWPATLLALAGITGYALRLTSTDIAAPLMHMLVALLAVRLLARKQARDYLQIFVLALFVLAGSSLLTLAYSFIVYLVLLVFVVTIGLVLLTVYVTDPRLALPRPELWRLLRLAALLPSISLVLMFGFFVILPRTGQPLWTFLNPADTAVAGLADSVRPGAFARMSTAKSLAFRAEGPELPPELRYWRAIVMNTPRQGQWQRVEPPEHAAVQVAGGTPVAVTIYPEPRSDRHLVTLSQPVQLRGVRASQSADGVFRTAAAISQRFRFTVEAAVGAKLQVHGALPRAFYLRPPEPVSPRVAAAAAQIAAAGSDSQSRLQALAAFFRDRQLVYAQDDLPGGPDPVDAFLFDKRRGYCEYFASAYATLARLAGVPARLVGGYYGGDYNELGGYYLVTDDMAHVWVEVLTDDDSWQQIDPSQWASNATSALGGQRSAGLGAWQRLTDTLDYYWVQSVVVFDFDRQIELLRAARSNWRAFDPATVLGERRDWGLALAGGGILGLLCAGVLAVRRRRSREARLLAALRRRLRQRFGPGAAADHLGLGELAERLDNRACREFAAIYQGAVFRDRRLTAAEIARLRELLKEM